MGVVDGRLALPLLSIACAHRYAGGADGPGSKVRPPKLMAATQDRNKYGASKGPVNRLGSVLVPLGAPKRTKSSHKLAVPKPVNLPSLKKENAGNDPTTQLVPSGQSGWTAKGDEHEHRAASLVERSTWASGEAPHPQQPPLPAWQRAGSLNPMDFPSLAAAAKGQHQQQHVRPLPDQQAGNWDEDEREHSYGPRSSLLERGAPGGRDGPPHRMDPGGYGGRGYQESEPGYSREGRHTPSEGNYGRDYERGHYRDGPPYGREGGYGRDSRQDWEDRYGREQYPPRYDRPPSYGGSQRSQRYENGGRYGGGSEPYRRYGSEGYGDDYGRGEYGLRDDGYDARLPRYERPSRQPYSSPSPEYDPELFPPMPVGASEPERLRAPTGERDHEREAFNAELERVAAELDKKRQPGHGRMEDGRGPHAGGRAEGAEFSDEGEQASYAARAGSRWGMREEEDRSRHEAAAWKQQEPEDRLVQQEREGLGQWEDGPQREEMAQRRARELADAQAAAHAALSRPPPPGAEPAFERRPPPPGGYERRAEARGGGSPPPPVPPPPPPPRQPPPREQQAPAPPLPASPRVHAALVPPPQPAAEAPAVEVSCAPPPPPSQPTRPPPAPLPSTAEQEQTMPAEQRPPAPGPPAQPVASSRAGPGPRPPKPSSRPDQGQVQQAQLQQRDTGGVAPPAPAPAPPPPAPPAPPPAPVRSSLVKPGASWRSILSGVPDAPPQPAVADEQQQPAGRQRASSASAKAAREGKRGKGRGAARPVAAGAGQQPAAEAVPPSAEAPAAGKGKRGKGSKGQKGPATAHPAQAVAAPEQQQPAQAQRGGRRQQQQQQQQQQKEQKEGTAGARRERGKARDRGAKASQGQPVDVAAGVGVAGAAVAEQLPVEHLPPAQPELEEPGVAPLLVVPPADKGGVPAGEAAPAGSEALGAGPMGPASSAAAFGWSSPLADEVAKLQLSAAASADVELATEVAAAAAAASAASVGLGASMAPLLDSDLLEPSPLQDSSGVGSAVALEPHSASPPGLGQEGQVSTQSVPAANALADLLGDDVITALPADLTLDLAGGGSSAGTSTAAAGSFALPPQQASPPPFPGGLFPLPAMAVGGSNPWQPSPTLQEPGASVPGLAAAAQSLYSLAQQPHITFGTHIPITSTQPPTLPGPQYVRQTQQQQQAAAAAAVAAFGQQAASLQFGQQPGSFLMQPAAFIPTGKQPDWSTPQGRTASPVPLPSYSIPPQSQSQAMEESMLPYASRPMPGVYGRGLPGAPMPLPPSMQQYPHQHQQTLSSPRPGFAPSPLPPQQQQQYDPAAALPDDVFWEGNTTASLTAPGPVPNGGPQGRRGPRQDGGGRGGRQRYDGGMPPNMHPQQMGPPPMFMMNGMPGRGPPAAYFGRGGMMGPGMPRQQHITGGGMGRQGQGIPPPPPPEGGGGRGGRPRAGRAGRSGRGSNSGGGPQQQPTKNAYASAQQQGAGMTAQQRPSSGSG